MLLTLFLHSWRAAFITTCGDNHAKPAGKPDGARWRKRQTGRRWLRMARVAPAFVACYNLVGIKHGKVVHAAE